MSESDYFVIDAKRWFERVNGNTYHSVSVYKNGELLDREPYTYGYGTCYEQTALDLLHKHDIAKEFEILWQFAESIGREKVLIICNDVTRKRDL